MASPITSISISPRGTFAWVHCMYPGIEGFHREVKCFTTKLQIPVPGRTPLNCDLICETLERRVLILIGEATVLKPTTNTSVPLVPN